MKKNIFLTGEKGVGKSTLLNRFLSEYPCKTAGFRTLPYYSNGVRRGFYISRVTIPDTESASDEAAEACHQSNPALDAEQAMLSNYAGMISKEVSPGVWEPYTHVFDGEGAAILKESLDPKPDIILMDELGFLESQASNFQMYVRMCLDSPIPVLGVIKAAHTPFLDSIRGRDDVRVLEVTPFNRENVFRLLVKSF